MDSPRRIILVLAGSQGGKTTLGVWWLFWEMQERGPGDYLVAAPTYPILNLKTLPEFELLFRQRLRLGKLKRTPQPVFFVSRMGEKALWGGPQKTPTRVIFGHASDPDSLEAMTAQAALLDEAGQKKFRRGSWEAVQRRLSTTGGRIFIPTTPYGLGWLKGEVYDRYQAGDPEIDLIQFDSTQNPAFPQEEYDRMAERLPTWKFNMMYRGLFERPAGLIYDAFNRKKHLIKRFTIPTEWPRYLGLDFGGVNTAGVFLAAYPGTNRFVLYRTYHFGGRTARGHGEALLRGEPYPRLIAGGSGSEGQWRDEFAAAGLNVNEPAVTSVEVGIQRVYELLKMDRLDIFEDLLDIVDEMESYNRELDDNQEPTERIEDKAKYHRLDALRYIGSHLTETMPVRALG